MKRTGLFMTLATVFAIMILVSCSKTGNFDTVDDMVAFSEQYVEPIGIDEMKAKFDAKEDYYLIDVREANEHNFGFIPHSHNLPGGTILFRINEEKFWTDASLYPPQKDSEIILYCKKGKRSVISAYQLRQLGYTNVKYLEGGWKAWEMAFPLLYDKDLEHVWEEHVQEEGGC